VNAGTCVTDTLTTISASGIGNASPPVLCGTLTGSHRKNGDPTLLVHCLYQMSPLNHIRTTSSLVTPIFYVAKNYAKKE